MENTIVQVGNMLPSSIIAAGRFKSATFHNFSLHADVIILEMWCDFFQINCHDACFSCEQLSLVLLGQQLVFLLPKQQNAPLLLVFSTLWHPSGV
jgi:hypothetical protein